MSSSPVHALDNPIWSALSTEQRHLAEGNELAKRFPSNIGPLGAIKDQSPAAWQSLEPHAVTDPAALFLEEPPILPAGWTLVRSGLMCQMVYQQAAAPLQPPLPQTFRRLTREDIPKMLALTKLTEPGPFRQRTIELGSYWGIFDSGRLASMAGERLHPAGFTEVSAVCTHPDFRGRGYGNILVSAVAARIAARSETPFLHTFATNPAVHLYRKLGFTLRRYLHLAAVKYDAT